MTRRGIFVVLLLKRLWRNNLFRISLLYGTLFLIIAITTTSVAYFSIKKTMQASLERELNAEITRYIGTYQSSQLGIPADSYAFFIEQDGQKIAGNLSSLPRTEDQDLVNVRAQVINKIIERTVYDTDDRSNRIATQEPQTLASVEKNVDILGKSVEIGNTRLFIGRNSYGETARQGHVLGTLITSSIILTIIGLTGSFWLSYRAAKRIERISKISKAIMQGDLALRIPTSNDNDDIAELSNNLNQMLDKIHDLMQDVRRVSDNIAHDLRTPLTRLRGHIESIDRLAEDPSKIDAIQNNATQATHEIDSLLAIFSALLRIANIESGTANAHAEPVQLQHLLSELVDFYEVLAEEKSQTVHIDCPAELALVTDKNLLSQAIVNLLSNAVKYTPEQGRIDLRVQQQGNWVHIAVRDSGQGVPEELLSQLGRRFYRLEKHRASNEGNGLGLALVKAIVHRLGGELQLKNEAGLVATLILPQNGVR